MEAVMTKTRDDELFDEGFETEDDEYDNGDF